jgi:hypothetical protein
VEAEMTPRARLTIAVAALASVLAANPKSALAQESCAALPNPVVVVGSIDFEPLLRQFAVRLAAESPPTTIISVALLSQAKSCAGVRSIAAATDFGGAPGRYYTLLADDTIGTKTCTFPAGQTAHVAISDVFYESCADAPQPRPADVMDVLGPAQATLFVVPRVANASTEYITHDEARAIYGCGVSSSRTVADIFNDSTWVFCRDPAAGTQIVMSKTLGLEAATLPACQFYASDAKLLFDFVLRDQDPLNPGDDHKPIPGTIGFVSASAYFGGRSEGRALAFQAAGQTRAYYPDSSPTATDRKNVRDGHYPIWGYVHLISRMSGGSISPQAAELGAWINGSKASPNISHLTLEVGAGLIPQCAMKVKRSSDGGLLSPYSPPQSCNCGYDAITSGAFPPGCSPCTSASQCSSSLTCRHGFCE